MIRFMILISFLISFGQAFAQNDSKSYTVQSLEEAYKRSILEIATVQFGSPEAVAAVVKIGLKVPPPPAPDDSLDVGYLPVPANRNLASANSNEDILKNINTIDVTLYASSLLEKPALASFQTSVRQLFGRFPVKVSMQTVKFTDWDAKKKAKEPTPKETPKEEKPKEDEFSKKTLVYLWTGAFLLAAFFVGLMIFMGISGLSRAIQKGASALGQGIVQMKQTGSVTSKSDGDGKILLGGAGAGNGEGLNPGALLSRPGSVEQCLVILRRYCNAEPMKVVNSLRSDVPDQLGVRWLLSQLPDEDQIQIKNFLGIERIKALAQPMTPPAQFNLLTWSQDFIERITLRRLEGAASLEKSLSSNDLSFLYQVSEDAAFEAARDMATPEGWRLALEVITPATLSKKSAQVTPSDWQIILNAMLVDTASLTFSFAQFRRKIDAMKTATAVQEVDPQFEMKVISPLVDSIKMMPFGKDEDFLFGLKKTHPDIVQQIRKRFWTFEDLRNVEDSSLKSFIGNLGNESLLALLLVCSERDRETFKQYIPEGMKRTVVLDLLEKAKTKADPREAESSIAVVRDILDKAFKLNQSGRLPTKVKALAA